MDSLLVRSEKYHELLEQNDIVDVTRLRDIGIYNGRKFIVVLGTGLTGIYEWIEYLTGGTSLYGVDWGYSDDYKVCYMCRSAVVRIAPSNKADSYYRDDNEEDSGVICVDCVNKDIESYLTELRAVRDIPRFPAGMKIEDACFNKLLSADRYISDTEGPEELVSFLRSCGFEVLVSKYDGDVYVRFSPDSYGNGNLEIPSTLLDVVRDVVSTTKSNGEVVVEIPHWYQYNGGKDE